MSGILSKLFTHNGKVPWIQLIVGIIVGVLASLSLIKIQKPNFIMATLGLSAPPATCAVNKTKQENIGSHPKPLKTSQLPPKEAKRTKPATVPDEQFDDADYDEILSSRIFPVPIFAVSEEITLPADKNHISDYLSEEEENEEIDENVGADDKE